MFIDTHTHSWDPTTLPYDWLRGDDRLDRTLVYQRHPADVAVFVEGGARASHATQEALWAASLRGADGEPLFAAIVAQMRLDGPRQRERLTALRAVPRLVGVRHVLQELPAGPLRDPLFVRRLEDVATEGLAFDVCVRPGQLRDVVPLIRAVPHGSYVLDHLGAPPVAEPVTSSAGREWFAALKSFADETEATVKLSGSGLAVDYPPTAVARARDYLRAAFDLFGPARCMIGSDWPVSTGPNRPSPRSWATFVLDTVRLSGRDREAVAAGTARRVYRLARDETAIGQGPPEGLWNADTESPRGP
jgi:L-fuconolactonase